MTVSEDRAVIRDMVESWVIWRDSGRWDRLLTLWHDDGMMSATWRQSSAADFVAGARAAWERGADTLHFLGGMTIDLGVGPARNRAIAQTKMTIGRRALVHDVAVDVVCEGRFYDFFERRDGRWGIVLRQAIYERDRMDPVDPGASVTLDPTVLAAFPIGYRHLAYLQTVAGITVSTALPGRTGPAVDDLHARGAAWLDGTSEHPAAYPATAARV